LLCRLRYVFQKRIGPVYLTRILALVDRNSLWRRVIVFFAVSDTTISIDRELAEQSRIVRVSLVKGASTFVEHAKRLGDIWKIDIRHRDLRGAFSRGEQ